jgi:hypothetical protein
MVFPIHSCFDPLFEDNVTDRSLESLLRVESRDAIVNGLEAAVIVLAVLLWEGVAPWIIAISVVGAIAFGTLLHQIVLVGGVIVLRLREDGATAA